MKVPKGVPEVPNDKNKLALLCSKLNALIGASASIIKHTASYKQNIFVQNLQFLKDKLGYASYETDENNMTQENLYEYLIRLTYTPFHMTN